MRQPLQTVSALIKLPPLHKDGLAEEWVTQPLHAQAFAEEGLRRYLKEVAIRKDLGNTVQSRVSMPKKAPRIVEFKRPNSRLKQSEQIRQ
jgi:hypothetical protein